MIESRQRVLDIISCLTPDIRNQKDIQKGNLDESYY